MELVPQQSSLQNGILSLIRTGKFKSGLLSVTTLLPITQKSACLGPLLLSVLRRGTEKYPSLPAINRRLDDLYGTGISIRPFYLGDRLALFCSAELLDEAYLPEPVDLLAGVGELIGQILFHPLLDENGLLCEALVESEKELQKEKIRSLKDAPRSYAYSRLLHFFHEGEPVGFPIFGTEEEVAAVTPRELTDFWHQFKESFCPVCFSVGSLPGERIRAVLEENLPRSGASLPSLYLREPPLSAKTVRRVEEPMDISQGHLLLGFRAGTFAGMPGSTAVTVLTELLGGSSSSRLFRNIREAYGFCYSIGAYYRAERGMVMLHCSMRPDRRAFAEEKLLSELEAIRAGKFSDEELDIAKKSLRNVCRQMQDSPSSLEDFYRFRLLRGVDDTLAAQGTRIASITREDVIAAARALSLDTVYFLRGTQRGGDADVPDDEI